MKLRRFRTRPAGLIVASDAIKQPYDVGVSIVGWQDMSDVDKLSAVSRQLSLYVLDTSVTTAAPLAAAINQFVANFHWPDGSDSSVAADCDHWGALSADEKSSRVVGVLRAELPRWSGGYYTPMADDVAAAVAGVDASCVNIISGAQQQANAAQTQAQQQAARAIAAQTQAQSQIQQSQQQTQKWMMVAVGALVVGGGLWWWSRRS